MKRIDSIDAVPADFLHAVRDQLEDELTVRLADSAADLLGLDLREALVTRIRERAGLHAANLAHEGPTAHATVVDVMHALFGTAAGPVAPEDVDPGWWRTPLGRACARHLASAASDPDDDRAETLTAAATASILGVPRGTVLSWTHRGQLDRHPDGGILRTSVLQRLAGGC